jgi:hypothetical protein
MARYCLRTRTSRPLGTGTRDILPLHRLLHTEQASSSGWRDSSRFWTGYLCYHGASVCVRGPSVATTCLLRKSSSIPTACCIIAVPLTSGETGQLHRHVLHYRPVHLRRRAQVSGEPSRSVGIQGDTGFQSLSNGFGQSSLFRLSSSPQNLRGTSCATTSLKRRSAVSEGFKTSPA